MTAAAGAGADLDRLTHHCPILEAKGESFRLRDDRRRQRRATGTAWPTDPRSHRLPQSSFNPTPALHFSTAPRCTFQPAFTHVRAALKLADSLAPCVLFCDEIEKALAGATSSGQTDSGVTARVFGSSLTWLNDHESDVFFVGTCNDASKLPPEFARAERFDGVFFLDLPGRDQKDAIRAIDTRHHGLDAKQARPDDSNWTGAEIKSCCRLASLLDVPLVQATQNVVPVAVTAGDKIEGLRQWASGRCLSADRGGVFTGTGAGWRWQWKASKAGGAGGLRPA
jgi:hypothetical protein